MLSKETYSILDDIISKFDFELIHSYMVINKWYWQNEKTAPCIIDLKNIARSLLLEVFKASKKNESDEYTFSSTGGFKASYYKRCNEFWLEFIIEKKYTSGN